MRKIVAGLSALTVLAVASVAFSNAGGTSGNSGKQQQNCNSCHTGGLQPVVEIVGPRKVDAGSTVDLRFYVRPRGYVEGGADGAIDAGDAGILYDYGITGANIAADDDVQLLASTNGGLKGENGELTHIAPMAASDAGEAVYRFAVKAPQYGGFYTIYASGNAANGDGTQNGDMAQSTTFAIQVNGPARPGTGGTDPGTTGGGTGGNGGTGGGGGTDPEQPNYGNAQPSNDSGGCDVGAVGSGSALGSLLVLPALIFIARRRKKK